MQARKVKDRKVKYAVTGAGWISQAEFMPGVEHTGNSELCALVTGSEEKAAKLGDRYSIPRTYTYDEYDAMLFSGEIDAAEDQVQKLSPHEEPELVGAHKPSEG
jgi:hypothetical protein